MRFTFNATIKPGHDIETLAITFSAPTWPAARETAEKFLEQLGYRAKELVTYEIVYARKIVLENEYDA